MRNRAADALSAEFSYQHVHRSVSDTNPMHSGDVFERGQVPEPKASPNAGFQRREMRVHPRFRQHTRPPCFRLQTALQIRPELDIPPTRPAGVKARVQLAMQVSFYTKEASCFARSTQQANSWLAQTITAARRQSAWRSPAAREKFLALRSFGFS